MDNYSTDLQKLQDELGVNVQAHAERRSWRRSSTAWDTLIPTLEAGRVHQEGAGQPARLGRAGRLLPAHERADYELAYEHYFPGKLPA